MRMTLYPTVAERLGRLIPRRVPFPMYVRASDGYAAVNALNAQHFRDAFLFMGLDEEAENQGFAGDLVARLAAAPRLQKLMDAWAADKTREEIFSVGQAMRIPAGIPFTLLELVQEENYRERGFFQPLTTKAGVVQQPIGPYGPDAVRNDRREAPKLGQDTDDVLTDWLEGGRETVTHESIPAQSEE
jgi:crotonobetainyl-CoA:carnitine CoA-transferase CaiB-like acyl-CoA transferase